MLIKKLEFSISQDIFFALNEKPVEIVKDIKTFAAVKFFENGKLSLGKALKLAGMNKIDFIKLLSSQKISVYNYAPEELEEDIDNISRASGKKAR